MNPSAPPATSPRIAVIDDDASVRASIVMLLDTRGWQATEFERASDFLDGASPASFHCLLIDVRIPGMSGLELFDALIRRARNSGEYVPPTLFLSGHGDIPMVVRALQQGAADFLEKPADPRTLQDAIAKALARDQAARSAHQAQAGLLQAIAGLTLRERQVLSETVAGYLSKQIAARLNISTKTVETHRLHIYQKFNVHTSMELAAKLRDLPPELWQKTGE